MNETKPKTATEVQYVSVAKIAGGKYDARAWVDPEKDRELAASIKEKGVLVPIAVRRVGSAYELIAGHRRLLAAKAAGLVEVPAIILEVDDQGAREINLVENVLRENLHPLEEARGIAELIAHKKKALLAEGRLTPEFQGSGLRDSIADRIGKPRPYVRRRLSLLDLIEDWSGNYILRTHISLDFCLGVHYIKV